MPLIKCIVYCVCVCVCVCVYQLLSHVRSDSLRPHGLYLPAFSVHGILQEYWSGLPFTPPGDLPNPGIKPWSLALQADSLPSKPPGNRLFIVAISREGWERGLIFKMYVDTS